MDNYKIVKRIHNGKNSRIFLAKNLHPTTNNDQFVVIKVADHGQKGKIDESKRTLEYDCMRIASMHPNVTKIYDCIEIPEKRRNFFGFNLTGPIIIIEYCPGGSLYEHVKSRNRLSIYESRKFFGQIGEALSFIHRRGIAHRDIKLENVLLDSRGNAKLTDFGLSAFIDPEKRLTDSCGSPHYAAPEVWDKIPYVGPELDVWGLGVCLYAMITGGLPFKDKEIDHIKLRVRQGLVPKHFMFDEIIWNLIKQMLNVDLNQRCTIEDALSHDWMHPLLKETTQSISSFYHHLNPNESSVHHSTTSNTKSDSSLKTQASDSPNTINVVASANVKKDGFTIENHVNRLSSRVKQIVHSLHHSPNTSTTNHELY